MSKPTAILEKPTAIERAASATQAVDGAGDGRRARMLDRLTIARAAVVVAWVLVATAAALAMSALLLHQQAVDLDVHGANEGGVLGLLTLGALALLGALAASVAAVNQQPKRISGWVSLIASGLALLALLLVTLPMPMPLALP
jgi:hypothetical protein